MAVVSKGMHVYMMDPADNSVVVVECATNVTPGTSPKEQVETTCLEDTERDYKPGMRTPGQGSITINVDPSKDSHVRMHELYEDDTVDNTKWAIGWPDGSAAPTVDSNGDWVFPTTRTYFSWNAYIADFPFVFELNAVQSTQVTTQRKKNTSDSGWHRKAS
ncbi:phage tail tube protein [Methylophaga sp. OBS4]|uniref:phage tail tube protein n=1 Tax=Methylophaga sp. OBS4 TaxID=2991935 RepID=UPI002254A5B9|nr:phage tail tube protein [Methylophaga sp. OBS4]MCX4186773.1 hypothetical protein [Methylophaga sp. OBS4]